MFSQAGPRYKTGDRMISSSRILKLKGCLPESMRKSRMPKDHMSHGNECVSPETISGAMYVFDPTNEVSFK